MAGSKSLGTLTLNLLIQTGSFLEGMSKAERGTKKFSDSVKKDMSAASKAFVGFVAGATAATSLLIKNSIDTAATLDDVSQTTGIAVEKLSALKYAAEFEGVAFENLSGTLNKFSKNVKEAASGAGDAFDAFRGMGIELRNTDGSLKSSDQLLLEIADRFAHMEDSATKAAYAQKFFGKTGAEMIPFLNRGRDGIAELTDEAERFGHIVSAATAHAADEFNDNLHRLKSIISGTGLELAGSLLPQMVEFTNLISDPGIQQRIASLVSGIADIGISAVRASVGLIDFVHWLGEAFAAHDSGAALDDLVRLEDQLKDINALIKKMDQPDADFGNDAQYKALVERKKVLEQMIALNHELSNGSSSGIDSAKAAADTKILSDYYRNLLKSSADPDALDAAAKLHDAAMKKLEDYEKELALVGKVTEQQKLQYEIASGSLKGINAADKEQLKNKAALVDLNNKLKDDSEILSAYYKDLIADGEKQAENDKKAQEDRLAQYVELTANLDEQIALYGDVSRVTKGLYETSVGSLKDLTDEQKNHIMLQYEDLDNLDRLAKAEEERKKAREEQEKAWKELGLDAAKEVQSAFADALMGVESNFGETLKRMAAEFTASSLLKALGGFLQNSGSEALATLGGMFVGKFATGGSIGAGQWGIVGETGAEIVSGPAYVTGQKQTESMMRSGNNITIPIDLSGIKNADEAAMASSSVKRAVLAAVRESGRYG